MRGTLLLAHEGINGTLAGSREAIGSFLERLEREPAIGALEVKFSFAEEQPFYRMKVRLKKKLSHSVSPLLTRRIRWALTLTQQIGIA